MAYWKIKKISVEKGDPYGHSYKLSSGVLKALKEGWETFAVSLEQGGMCSGYPSLWLKMQVTNKDDVSAKVFLGDDV